MKHSTGRLLAIVLPIIAIACADAPTAPTAPTSIQAVVSLDAPAPKAPAVVGAPRSHMMIQPTLTLTVTPDGDRDRVRASIGGIVGVSFYPGPGEKMPPNPLHGHGGQSITVRCDRTVSWRGGRPRVRTIPEAKRRNGDGVEIRVWVEHNGRRLTHAGNPWAADGGSQHRVCAP